MTKKNVVNTLGKKKRGAGGHKRSFGNSHDGPTSSVARAAAGHPGRGGLLLQVPPGQGGQPRRARPGPAADRRWWWVWVAAQTRPRRRKNSSVKRIPTGLLISFSRTEKNAKTRCGSLMTRKGSRNFANFIIQSGFSCANEFKKVPVGTSVY